MEEAWRKSALRFIHGVLLHEICDKLLIDNTRENRSAIKEMFKRHERIDTLKNLTAIELKVFMERVAAFLGSEYGIEVRLLGDPIEDTPDTSLQDFLKLVYKHKL